MSAKTSCKDGPQHFPHKTGDVVLVKWRDGKIYFAKIKTIEWSKKRCVVIFDDKSQDLARFSWIHDVNETTTDIICVKCKQDCSDKGNEIVLCDQCGYGYHQKCHETKILQRALEDDSSWICYFCEQEMACPYVTNADALTQSLEDIEDKPEKSKPKKRKQSMKITTETNKKYCTGLLADSPTVEQSGEEEAIGEHHMEQSTPISGKPHKTQSRRKSKPYKVEICSSISKEYFVDDEDDTGSETPSSSSSRKIKRKTPLTEGPDIATKKHSSSITESPSGVGIFSFEMPTEFHSNLHQLAMASQLVSQSPSGEVPNSVIRAIENEQKNQQEYNKMSSGSNREKPKSLVLSIPRSPLISISGKQSTTTPALSLTRQPTLESSTPSCSASTATAIPSPVIVSNHNGKTTSPLETAIVSSATPAVTQPGSPDSGESVFTYPNSTVSDNDVVVVSHQSKSTTAPAIVRVDSGDSDVVFTSCVPPSETVTTKVAEPLVIVPTSSSRAPTMTTPASAHPIVSATPVKQNGAFFECPPPVSMVTKPTSIQFVNKNTAGVKVTSSSASVTTPTIAASPVIMHSPSLRATPTSAMMRGSLTPSTMRATPTSSSATMIRTTPTPVTPATQPVYYVQISGGSPSHPLLVRPIKQQQTQSPIVIASGGPVMGHTQPGSHGDQQANHLNGTKSQKSSSHHDNIKEAHTMQFANQVKDMGTNISVKMGATYNMVSEYMLISKFEEAWNKLNELSAQWPHQPKQTSSVTKKPVAVTKTPERPPVSNGRDKVVMVAQQQPQQQQQRIQHQTLTTPVQLVPISTPHHVTTPIVHGDVVSVLPSPAHVISTPGHVISTPVVIPAVARTGPDVTYYSIPPKTAASINPAAAVHSHKKKDEVYMVQVVKPVAPVMPVTQVMPSRSSEKRTPQQCDVCSKKASFLCSGCQSAWYCGRSCQYNVWQEHSHRCHKKSSS